MSLYQQVFVSFFLFNGTNFQSSPEKTTANEQRPVTLQFPKGRDANVIILKDSEIFYTIEWNYDNRILSVQGNKLNLTILSPVVSDSGIYSHNGFEVELLVIKSPPPTELPASIKETDVSTWNMTFIGLMITIIILLTFNILIVVHMQKSLQTLLSFIKKCDISQIVSQETRLSIPNSSGDETEAMICVEEIDNQSTGQLEDKIVTCFNSKNVCINNKFDEPSHENYQVEDVENNVDAIKKIFGDTVY